MRISDWSSDVCSSDLVQQKLAQAGIRSKDLAVTVIFGRLVLPILLGGLAAFLIYGVDMWPDLTPIKRAAGTMIALILGYKAPDLFVQNKRQKRTDAIRKGLRSEEHTSELQSLMRISYAVFCLKNIKHT